MRLTISIFFYIIHFYGEYYLSDPLDCGTGNNYLALNKFQK